VNYRAGELHGAHEFDAHVLEHVPDSIGPLHGETSQRAGRPIITARVLSRQALNMSVPRRMPPSTSTSALPDKAADATSPIVSR
jgi:hypothetical protein